MKKNKYIGITQGYFLKYAWSKTHVRDTLYVQGGGGGGVDDTGRLWD